MTEAIYIIAAGILGALLGYFIFFLITLLKKNSLNSKLETKLLEAKKKAQAIEEEALTEAKVTKEKLDQAESRLGKKEERLEKKEDDLESKLEALDLEKEKLTLTAEKLKNLQAKIEATEQATETKLQEIAQLTEEEAKEILFAKITQENSEDLRLRYLKLSKDGEQILEKKAKEILAVSIQRLANSQSSELMSSVVELKNEEDKGRIIGKEGRNIKTFERESGVELLVDEIPDAVVVSSFDPIRRAIATQALEELLKDGRIQPAKIEEALERAKKNIGILIRKKGEEAILETGILNLPEEIIPILGRLYFRTSYGQNVLEHSIEMAHLAGMLASELGANIEVAKAGALVHDLGKAVDHEIAGTHVEIGRKILAKYGVDERIIKAMQAHHEEYPYETLESIIVQTADAISGSRPGARRDSLENYIQRLTDLENVVTGFLGIEKVYVIQAGREIRVFVEPNQINDLEAVSLARNIAIKIETEIRYPGEIKINVIRESRVIEFAR